MKATAGRRREWIPYFTLESPEQNFAMRCPIGDPESIPPSLWNPLSPHTPGDAAIAVRGLSYLPQRQMSERPALRGYSDPNAPPSYL